MKKFDNIKNRFPVNPWDISEKKYNPSDYFTNETLFACANGFIGVRGSFEEGNYLGHSGTYINAFYESNKIEYGEKYVGYPSEGQSMVNVANSIKIEISIDDEILDINKGELIDYNRKLDFRNGILKRKIIWKTQSGKKAEISFNRLVSFENKHLIAQKIEITPLNFDGEITYKSFLDGTIKNYIDEDDPRIDNKFKKSVFKTRELYNDEFMFLNQITKKSGKEYSVGLKESIISKSKYKVKKYKDTDKLYNEYRIKAKKEKTITIEKFSVYYTEMNYLKKQKIEVELEKAFEKGWDYYEKFQKEYLEKFWNDSYIKIDGDDALTQGIRFNMFHLLQSTGKDGYTNIGAKGLTGEGYEGHYFWDTETYVLPFFLYTQPETAKKLLEFRYNTLDAARDRAKEMSHTKGALYPWRTINGYECSSYYPAGTAQYHINADIAFALKQYYQVTDDFDFIKSMGIEILVETARLWEDAGSYNSEGQFCINCVTGPDEYTALINNNYYTNLMAAENLSFASEMVEKIKTESPEIYQELKNKLKLSEEEHFGWEKHAEKMFYPYDEKLKINAQDDSFLSKPIWELDKTPKEKFPLLLNYHPLVLYRYQVIKQADLILAEALLPHKFSDEQVKRDYDYYEKLTTHDSSLSTCIYSIVANRIGYEKEAYEYFINTSRTDLDNYQGNTKDGIHSASMAGTWLGVVMGFGGMKIYNNELHFDPKIPEKWNEYTFKIKFKNRIIKVKVDKTKADYSLEKGEPLTIYNKGNKIELS